MSPRERLAKLAETYHDAAVQAHLRAMRLTGAAARIEQASRILSDEMVLEYLARMEKALEADSGEDIQTTAKGGNA